MGSPYGRAILRAGGLLLSTGTWLWLAFNNMVGYESFFFLPSWYLILQTMYFMWACLRLVDGPRAAKKKDKSWPPKDFTDYSTDERYFETLASMTFVLAWVIFMGFWTLHLLSAKNVGLMDWDHKHPTLLNHLAHTVPALLMSAEFVMFRHAPLFGDDDVAVMTAAGVLTFVSTYIFVLYLGFLYHGVYPYPFMRDFGVPSLLMLWVVMLAFCAGTMVGGEYVRGLLREVRKTSKHGGAPASRVVRRDAGRGGATLRSGRGRGAGGSASGEAVARPNAPAAT